MMRALEFSEVHCGRRCSVNMSCQTCQNASNSKCKQAKIHLLGSFFDVPQRLTIVVELGLLAAVEAELLASPRDSTEAELLAAVMTDSTTV